MRARGFTVVELLVVLAAIGLLLAVAAPRYVRHLDNARDVALRHNLERMRTAIDQFRADQGRPPADLQELVTTKYLRSVPIDPLTDRSDTWRSVSSRTGTGIEDVRSGATGTASDGTAYASW